MGDADAASIRAARSDWVSEHLAMYLTSGGTRGHIMDVSAVGGRALTTHCLIKCVGRKSAKEAFYREGLKLPRPYMAKLFRWAAFGDWWDAYALVKVPTLVIAGRVSKVPVKIAQGIHEAVPGSSFVVFEADEGGGHAMFWEGPQKYNDLLRTFMRSS